MMTAVATETQVTQRSRGLGYFWLGIGLCLLSVIAVFVQWGVGWLRTPWYSPVLATLGAFLLTFPGRHRRVWVRIISLAFVALAVFGWFFVVERASLPEYRGPARGGQPVPAFQTKLADGSDFTEKNLQD